MVALVITRSRLLSIAIDYFHGYETFMNSLNGIIQDLESLHLNMTLNSVVTDIQVHFLIQVYLPVSSLTVRVQDTKPTVVDGAVSKHFKL